MMRHVFTFEIPKVLKRKGGFAEAILRKESMNVDRYPAFAAGLFAVPGPPDISLGVSRLVFPRHFAHNKTL
jgi:hypothetical protein